MKGRTHSSVELIVNKVWTQLMWIVSIVVLSPVVRKVDNAIYRINLYSVNRAVFTWLSKGIGFGFGFTTPFGWLVYLLWFWFYDSQVKTALTQLASLKLIRWKVMYPVDSAIQRLNNRALAYIVETTYLWDMILTPPGVLLTDKS